MVTTLREPPLCLEEDQIHARKLVECPSSPTQSHDSSDPRIEHEEENA
jgi:hypothetical protein